MRIMSWNCRGLGNPRAVRALKKLIKRQDPTLVFLMETRKKAHEMNKLKNLGSLTNVVAVDCRGDGKERVGCLAIMWKNTVDINVFYYS